MSMNTYDIFNADGLYLRSASCTDIEHQVQPGELWAEHDGHPSHCKVVADGVVHNLPPQPSMLHRACTKTKKWVLNGPAPDPWIVPRSRRNVMIAATDWTQLADVPASTRAKWTAYRQELRDITKQPDPTNIVWPKPPQ